MGEHVIEPPYGQNNMAAYRLAQRRKYYPYGGEAVDRMSPAEAERRAAQLGLSSAAAMNKSAEALKLIYDVNESQHNRAVKAKLIEIGNFAGLDLRDLAFVEVLLGTPSAYTFRDPNDGSMAIGMDPGYWHMILLSYLLARMGKQHNDEFWFMGVEYKATQYFYMGQDNGGSELIDYANEIIARSGPGVREMTENFVGAAISMILAHEVGHIALGHVGEGERFRLYPGSSDKTEASIFQDKRKELEADAWAAECLLGMAGNNFKEKTLAVTVPVLLFWLRAVPPLFLQPSTELGRSETNHYPSNSTRARALQHIAADHAIEVRPSNAMVHFVELSAWVSNIVGRWTADPAKQNRRFKKWYERNVGTL
jgi:hypothetical protein